MDSAYWYNVTSKDEFSSETLPANDIYAYRIGIKGVDTTYHPTTWQYKDYKIWVISSNSRCTTSFRNGRVTGVIIKTRY